MPEPKTFIYRYEGEREEEELHDSLGTIGVPRRGDLLYLKDKTWKVLSVFLEHNSPNPRYHIRLMDVSKPHLVN
jgi:hypothetical protein